MNGRIGVAKRVHVLEKFLDKGDWAWGTSLCGWAGSCVKTDGQPTCYACKLKSKKAAQTEILTEESKA